MISNSGKTGLKSNGSTPNDNLPSFGYTPDRATSAWGVSVDDVYSDEELGDEIWKQHFSSVTNGSSSNEYHVAFLPTTARDTSIDGEDSDEELGAQIWKSSRTAKDIAVRAKKEAATAAAVSSLYERLENKKQTVSNTTGACYSPTPNVITVTRKRQIPAKNDDESMCKTSSCEAYTDYENVGGLFIQGVFVQQKCQQKESLTAMKDVPKALNKGGICCDNLENPITCIYEGCACHAREGVYVKHRKRCKMHRLGEFINGAVKGGVSCHKGDRGLGKNSGEESQRLFPKRNPHKAEKKCTALPPVKYAQLSRDATAAPPALSERTGSYPRQYRVANPQIHPYNPYPPPQSWPGRPLPPPPRYGFDPSSWHMQRHPYLEETPAYNQYYGHPHDGPFPLPFSCYHPHPCSGSARQPPSVQHPPPSNPEADPDHNQYYGHPYGGPFPRPAIYYNQHLCSGSVRHPPSVQYQPPSKLYRRGSPLPHYMLPHHPHWHTKWRVRPQGTRHATFKMKWNGTDT